jgi:hypothetical protein
MKNQQIIPGRWWIGPEREGILVAGRDVAVVSARPPCSFKIPCSLTVSALQ